MDRKELELNEVIADLKLIKEAVTKSDNFFRFIDTRRAMRGVMLTAGLMTTFFCLPLLLLHHQLRLFFGYTAKCQDHPFRPGRDWLDQPWFYQGRWVYQKRSGDQ
jgi:hypothetical protein